jgi:CheY-like chemotaxis protein
LANGPHAAWRAGRPEEPRMACILVAEDEWLIAASYEAALGRAGHEVVSAADGR